MAFSSTITNPSGRPSVIGDVAIVFGTFDAASATSGSIVTGLSQIYYCEIRNKTTAGAGLVDDTTTDGTMAISGLTTSDTGEWMAIGRL